MATKIGTITKSTGAQPVSQDSPSLGFDPATVILWAAGVTTENNVDEDDYMFAIGAAVSGSEYCNATCEDDAAAEMLTKSKINSTKGFMILDPADGSVLAEGDITLGTDKFSINWTTNNAVAYIIKYLATTLNAELLTIASPGTGAGTQNVSTTNVPKGCIVFGRGAVLNTLRDHNYFMVGFADGTNQCVSQIFSKGNSAVSSECRRRFNDDSFIYMQDDSSTLAEASVTSFDSGPNQIVLSWVTDTSSRNFTVISFYEGDFSVVSGTSKTSAGTKAYTTTLQPDFAFSTGGSVTTLDTLQFHATMFFGASDGTVEASANFSARSAQADSEVKRGSSSTDFISCLDQANTTPFYEARVSSFNATDITIDFQGTPDTSAHYLGMMGVKEPVSGTTHQGELTAAMTFTVTPDGVVNHTGELTAPIVFTATPTTTMTIGGELQADIIFNASLTGKANYAANLTAPLTISCLPKGSIQGEDLTPFNPFNDFLYPHSIRPRT